MPAIQSEVPKAKKRENKVEKRSPQLHLEWNQALKKTLAKVRSKKVTKFQVLACRWFRIRLEFAQISTKPRLLNNIGGQILKPKFVQTKNAITFLL